MDQAQLRGFLLHDFAIAKKKLHDKKTTRDERIELSNKLFTITNKLCEIHPEKERSKLMTTKLFPEWFR